MKVIGEEENNIPRSEWEKDKPSVHTDQEVVAVTSERLYKLARGLRKEK